MSKDEDSLKPEDKNWSKSNTSQNTREENVEEITGDADNKNKAVPVGTISENAQINLVYQPEHDTPSSELLPADENQAPDETPQQPINPLDGEIGDFDINRVASNVNKPHLIAIFEKIGRSPNEATQPDTQRNLVCAQALLVWRQGKTRRQLVEMLKEVGMTRVACDITNCIIRLSGPTISGDH